MNKASPPGVKNWVEYLIVVTLVVAAAAVGSMFTPGEWYQQLDKPAWTPPNWVFPVAWTTLYAMIAVAGCLLLRADGWYGPAMRWWLGQLSLNALWSWLFFGQQQIDWALVDIVLLLASIGATVVLAWPRQRAAAWLLLPYLAWVGFATALNAAIWQLNR
ncbi:MAG: sensory protein TspO [Planctomycetaceae bacterium]|nr:sensory protein TspO [Planctomycetaceae bacterium]